MNNLNASSAPKRERSRAHLEVQHPHLIKATLGDFHVYPIAGIDALGETIETARRFNLFYEFRETLLLRFPGLYIPPLSPKQMTGRTEQLTLLERQFFLDQFLKQCCKLNYIAESKELELFLRFDGADLGKEISKL